MSVELRLDPPESTASHIHREIGPAIDSVRACRSDCILEDLRKRFLAVSIERAGRIDDRLVRAGVTGRLCLLFGRNRRNYSRLIGLAQFHRSEPYAACRARVRSKLRISPAASGMLVPGP